MEKNNTPSSNKNKTKNIWIIYKDDNFIVNENSSATKFEDPFMLIRKPEEKENNNEEKTKGTQKSDTAVVAEKNLDKEQLEKKHDKVVLTEKKNVKEESVEKKDDKEESVEKKDGKVESVEKKDGKVESVEKNDGKVESVEKKDGKVESVEKKNGKEESVEKKDGKEESIEKKNDNEKEKADTSKDLSLNKKNLHCAELNNYINDIFLDNVKVLLTYPYIHNQNLADDKETGISTSEKNDDTGNLSTPLDKNNPAKDDKMVPVKTSTELSNNVENNTPKTTEKTNFMAPSQEQISTADSIDMGNLNGLKKEINGKGNSKTETNEEVNKASENLFSEDKCIKKKYGGNSKKDLLMKNNIENVESTDANKTETISTLNASAEKNHDVSNNIITHDNDKTNHDSFNKITKNQVGSVLEKNEINNMNILSENTKRKSRFKVRKCICTEEYKFVKKPCVRRNKNMRNNSKKSADKSEN